MELEVLINRNSLLGSSEIPWCELGKIPRWIQPGSQSANTCRILLAVKARRRRDGDEHGAGPPHEGTTGAAEGSLSDRQGAGSRPEDSPKVHGARGFFTAGTYE
jgi:hypothetical protein